MKKRILLLLCLSLCVCTKPIYAEENGYEDWQFEETKLRFEGNHHREGEFYIVNDKDPDKNIIEAVALDVRWDNGIKKTYTLKNSQTLSYYKGSDYVEVQAITIAPQKVEIKKDLYVHKYPLEYYAYKTDEILPAGTYTIQKIAVDWLGVLKEDGSIAWVTTNLDPNDDYNYVSGKNAILEKAHPTLDNALYNGIKVNTDYMIDVISRPVRPGYANVPLYVTIHNTANFSNGADALMHAKLQYNKF